MEVIVCEDAIAVGAHAAAYAVRIAKDVGPEVVLGVATGSSPLSTFEHIAQAVARGDVDLRHARAFALDEYVGIPYDHPLSYHDTIRRTVTEPFKLDPANVHVPDGNAQDLRHAGELYEAMIHDAGGIDVQFLGVGGNGHIGFNEPTSSLASRTRVKTLTVQTRRDNARFFAEGEQVPKHCVTQGLGTILEARHIVLVASGSGKAHAIRQLVEGPVTAMCPGSVLQLHPDVRVIVDVEAASELQLRDYYTDVQANLPSWQQLPTH